MAGSHRITAADIANRYSSILSILQQLAEASRDEELVSMFEGMSVLGHRYVVDIPRTDRYVVGYITKNNAVAWADNRASVPDPHLDSWPAAKTRGIRIRWTSSDPEWILAFFNLAADELADSQLAAHQRMVDENLAVNKEP